MTKTKFVVIGRADCPWCKEATDLLSKQSIPFTYWDISSKQDRLRHFIKDIGLNTVPQIWLGSTLIGGYEDLKNYLDEESPDWQLDMFEYLGLPEPRPKAAD